MKNIHEWLEDNVAEFGSNVDIRHGSEIERQAEIVRASAQADGYSAEELREACGGDIAEFLRNRLGTLDAVGDKTAGDSFPVPPLGFKQE